MFRDMMFFISEALIGMRRSGIMIFISIATITVSLIVFGLFLLISVNINNLTNFVSSKLEIRVYLKNDLNPADIQAFQKRVEQMADVKEVIFVDKETAWKKFRDNFQTMDLADLMTENPLPDSLRVFLSHNEQIPVMAKYLRGFTQYVDDVGYMNSIAERIEIFARFTRIAGLVLVGLLTLATLLITVNTIRLTVIARQNEILIMHLVGATHPFIRWPFIIEGLIMGAIGSGIAVIFLKFFYTLFGVRFQETVPYFPLVFDPVTLNLIYAVVGIVGTSLGVLGAYISVSKSLKATI
jgi:cell division transport system permease protein